MDIEEEKGGEEKFCCNCGEPFTSDYGEIVCRDCWDLKISEE